MNSEPRLLDPLFGADSMRTIFSDGARLQGMLDFEAALAHAEARVGLIPARAAAIIAEQCRAELFDRGQLASATATAGNPAIPLVAALTHLVSEKDAEAAGYVHWGATSQDAMDTGLVLQMTRGLEHLQRDAASLSDALASMAEAHAATLVVGRTWLQHAVPITFGLKAAGWCAAVDRASARMADAGRAACILQFGGAAGSLASLGHGGAGAAAALGAELKLPVPELSWHAHRDRLADLGAALGLVTGVIGKIARDVSLLMQTEIAEASEPSAIGRGGSSTMPHKRNPVGCAIMLSNAVRAPHLVATLFAALPQEHERGLGGWHAEWDTLPELFVLAAGSLSHALEVLTNLTVSVDRMARNVEMTQGLVNAEAVMMALAPGMGRDRAHHLVEEASRSATNEGAHLRDVLARSPIVARHLQPSALDALFKPDAQAAQSRELVQRMLASRPRTQKAR